MNIKSKQVLPYVAAAVSLACGSALAATASPTATLSGIERNARNAAADPVSVVNLPAIAISVESNSYQTGDRVTLTLSGATLRAADQIGTVTCAQPAGTNVSGSLSLAYSSATGNVITLGVTRGNALPVYSVAGMVCTLPANSITVLSSSLASASTVTLAYQPATASGTNYDVLRDQNSTVTTPVAQPATMHYAITQYLVPTVAYRKYDNTIVTANADYTALDGVVYPNNTFAASTLSADGGVDILKWSTTDEGATGGSLAGGVANAAHSRVTTITGDFSFLDDNGDGCTTADFGQGAGKLVELTTAGLTAADATTGLAINAACTTITHTVTSTASAVFSHALAFAVGGATVAAATGTPTTQGSATGRTLAAQTFSGNVAFNRALATKAADVSFAPGAWTSSVVVGSGNVNVPYLPYGTGISRVIYATNKSTGAATANFTARSEAGVECSSTNFTAVTIPSKGVALLTGSIDAGIAACFGAGYSGKASVTVAITGQSVSGSNATSGVVVTSTYNVSGNRVNVLNSSN